MNVKAYATVALGALTLLAGCAETQVESGPRGSQETAPDPVLAALSRSGRWERTANPVRMAKTPPSGGFRMSAADRAAAAEAAAHDPTWYAADGERYEALYVLPDGTGYGRRGPAPDATAPDASNNYGAFPGLPSPAGQSGTPALPFVPPALGTGVPEGFVNTDVTYDRRSRYSNTTTLTTYPLRTAGSMSFDGTTGGGECSGTKIGPRDVLTAGHCVMDQNGNWTTSGTFNPGQTNTTTPNGSYAWGGVYARDWRVDEHSYDYAVFFVNDSQAFYDLGWMGVQWWNSASGYTGMNVSNRGYPCGPNTWCGPITNQRCKASPRSDLRCDGWMYGMDAALDSTAFRTDYPLLDYNNDVSEGHSGSAIFNSTPAVLAVVTDTDGVLTDECHGPRFRQSMWNDVCSWIADPNFQSAYGSYPGCTP